MISVKLTKQELKDIVDALAEGWGDTKAYEKLSKIQSSRDRKK